MIVDGGVTLSPDLASAQLRLQHPDLLLQLGNHLPAIAGGRGLSVLQPLLQLIALGEGGLGSPLHSGTDIG